MFAPKVTRPANPKELPVKPRRSVGADQVNRGWGQIKEAAVRDKIKAQLRKETNGLTPATAPARPVSAEDLSAVPKVADPKAPSPGAIVRRRSQDHPHDHRGDDGARCCRRWENRFVQSVHRLAWINRPAKASPICHAPGKTTANRVLNPARSRRNPVRRSRTHPSRSATAHRKLRRLSNGPQEKNGAVPLSGRPVTVHPPTERSAPPRNVERPERPAPVAEPRSVERPQRPAPRRNRPP